MSNDHYADVRERIKELAEVSRDLDRHTQLSRSASHPIQAQQVRKRIDELTAQQSSLMSALVAQHPDETRRVEFSKLSQKLDNLRDEIRGCEDQEQLIALEDQIETTVDHWVHGFQVIVSELAGVKPPDQAIYDH